MSGESNTPVGREGDTVRVPLVPVESGTIAAVGYAAEEQWLVVRFKNGGTYQYYGVPPQVHAALLAAPSKGTYLHLHIKPAYTVSKVTERR